MRHFRLFSLIAATALIGAPTMPSPVEHIAFPKTVAMPEGTIPLSVMTYNVKGLPWPAAYGREAALSEIGAQLRLMRHSGVLPHIVLLQEGFTEEARRLGREGGYPFAAFGPKAAPVMSRPPLGATFAHDAQTLAGEGVGAMLDSGLVLLSDYPIVKVVRFAFPAGACAGVDCLAAKGVMVAWLAIPGIDRPLAVVDTHLNARKASMVSVTRADLAYRWQTAAVRRYLESALGRDGPVIFAGDLNIGPHAARIAATSEPLLGSGQMDALATTVAQGRVSEASRVEALGVLRRNKDKIFARDGGGVTLTPVRAWVPFPLTTTSKPLSDHAGFVVDFALSNKPSIVARSEGSGGRTRART